MQSSHIPVHSDPNVQILRNFDESAAEHLKWVFFNDKREKWAKWDNLLKDKIFEGNYDVTLDQDRDLAYDRIKRVADENIVSIFDF